MDLKGDDAAESRGAFQRRKERMGEIIPLRVGKNQKVQ
jgi:hypothetical protein